MAATNEPRVGAFVDACIADVAKAKALAAADPSLLHAQWAGDPLLHWMVIEDFAAGVTTLLDLGVVVDARDEFGETALHHAARLGRLGIARLLLERGADPNAEHAGYPENPLHLAIAGEHLDVFMLLLMHGARGDYCLPTKETAFSAMKGMEPMFRETYVAQLAARGITRDGLFRTLQLERWGYDTPEEAFGW